MRHHGTAQIQKEETDGEAASVLLDGSAARRLCGAVCRLDADQALDLLFEQRKAAREGREAETIRKMARTYLEAAAHNLKTEAMTWKKASRRRRNTR